VEQQTHEHESDRVVEFKDMQRALDPRIVQPTSTEWQDLSLLLGFSFAREVN
jgi:hypothetical protein